MRISLTGLWRHPDFLKLWAGQTASQFGSLIGGTALGFAAVLTLNAGPAEMGLLATARLLPGFLIGLLAGAWVDRLRRRPIMIAADIGRAALLATIPLAAVLGVLRIEQLYLVALLVSILTIFFDVGYQSYLPTLVGRAALVEGNSKLATSAAAAEVSGFGLAGWLVQWLTAPLAILVDAVSFAVSALSIGLIRAPEPPPTPTAERRQVLREIGDGLRLVLAEPRLRALAGCSLTLHTAFGLIGATILLYTSRELGFEPGVLGLIFAVGGISSLVGATLAGPVTRRLGVGPTMVAGVALMGLSIFCIPLAAEASLVAALLLITQQLVGDGGNTVYEINQASLRQAVAPTRLLGRVNASLQFTITGATLVGSLLGGLLGETIGLRATLTLGAVGVLLSALWLLLSPVRLVRTQPAEPTAEAVAGG